MIPAGGGLRRARLWRDSGGTERMEQPIHEIILDKSVPIPLYYQLKKQVLGLIETSRLRAGDMLPPENELCDYLGVSRPTIRQAFRELVEEGYLARYKGKGTFVAKPKVKDRFLSKLESFHQEMLDKGMTPRTKVLALERLPADPECNEKLCLPFDAPLLHLSRLRSADNVQMVYVDTYLSYDSYPRLMDVDFSTCSLYEVLGDLYSVRVSRAQREIEAINARRREAELLKVAPNQALCLVKTLTYADGLEAPVEYSVARYRGDFTKFSVEIYR